MEKLKNFILETDNKKLQFEQSEFFNISGNMFLGNKISVTSLNMKADINKSVTMLNMKADLNKSENMKGNFYVILFQEIAVLVNMDEAFTLVNYSYNEKGKNDCLARKIALSSKISDNGKKIISSKIFYDTEKKSLFVFALTSNKVYVQNTEDTTTCKILLDVTNIDGHFISGIFEGLNSFVNPYCNSSSTIFILVNDSILVEVNMHKTEQNLENLLLNVLIRNKIEGKAKMIKYDVIQKSTSNNGNSYTVLTHEDMKNMKSVWKFSDKIICLKIRPKTQNIWSESPFNNSYCNNNYLAISFYGGKLKIFHYESRMLVNEYKTSYGNIIAMEYSHDGKLLGLGTESDNVYILDAEYGNLLYCLEGHKNYVTSLVFDEVNEEELIDKNLPEQKLNESHENLAYLSLNIQKPNNLLNKELSIKDFSYLFNDTDEFDNTVDIKRLRKSRTSVKHMIDVKEVNNISTYDLYTAGLDGCLGVWRLEYFYDEVLNEKNYFNVPYNKDSIQTIKIEQPAIINLLPSESNILFYSDMKRIRNAPMSQFYFYDNTILYVSKRNISATNYHLNFFSGKVILEETSETTATKTDKNNSLENLKAPSSPNISARPSDFKTKHLRDSSNMSSSVLFNSKKKMSNQTKINDSPNKNEKRYR